ncbi:hypothetical protein SY2F82_36190 [Streptomyces sp. Y2F8-2]|nr:hypothetical protein SY2F82_36190 [Streptomyces sp. Y2F8-2]
MSGPYDWDSVRGGCHPGGPGGGYWFSSAYLIAWPFAAALIREGEREKHSRSRTVPTGWYSCEYLGGHVSGSMRFPRRRSADGGGSTSGVEKDLSDTGEAAVQPVLCRDAR